MAVHFTKAEFESRLTSLCALMADEGLDAMLLFAQESMYWLTGYDTFGFCHFQCMVVTRDGRTVLLTRSADLRQAQQTSILSDIRVWVDRGGASPTEQLRDLLFEMDLLGSRLGVEYDTHGLTARLGKDLDETLRSFADLDDASSLVPLLRAVKSPAEIEYVRKAAELADDAWLAAMEEIKPDADEGRILAAMQGAIFEGGGDYPGNEFIIGSGRDALLCRYKSGRRRLSQNDQLTLEWAGVYRRYHAASMKTVVIGKPTAEHERLYAAALDALRHVEKSLKPGHTFGDLFDAHAVVLDRHGMQQHRLNACGYSLGARFSPSWMDWPMAYHANSAEIVPNMTIFMHMILADSATGTAMTLGRTYLTGEGDPECLSKLPLDLPVKAG
ncbi:aminopeptidase P family protein [Rhizobiales bacterium]|uniref:M24 family metallopeptidase n=1 Tax=Hongsoonwoonella zoysiae TaxID=2821844 RepID=UPI00155F6649|nr:Xaa-Pro peptidase family protein [Hongsoonwoonella zoysiae]NRG17643.1 aminopeptidase P family protein [Hongsoonwoonella zoysiae]